PLEGPKNIVMSPLACCLASKLDCGPKSWYQRSVPVESKMTTYPLPAAEMLAIEYPPDGVPSKCTATSASREGRGAVPYAILDPATVWFPRFDSIHNV